MNKYQPHRLRILHLLLLILIGISVLPLWFYGNRMLSTNQDALQTNERELQTVTSQSLAQEISLSQDNTRAGLLEFFSSVVPLATAIPASQYPSDPRLLEALQKFATEQPSVLFATVVNDEERGVQSGRYNAAADAFLRKAVDAAFIAARQGAVYEGNPITIVRNGKNEPVMVMARPLALNKKFLGMVAAVITLQPIVRRLDETHGTTGLDAYLVDNAGHLVASNNPDQNVAGMDMTDSPIVQRFLAWRGEVRGSETSPFELRRGNQSIAMLGTYSPVPNVGWGVIVERRLSEAYAYVSTLRRQTIGMGFAVILLSLGVGIVSAKSITRPLDQLTRVARSIAQRDFTQRADVRSRTEIGELGQAYNHMAEEIQHYIGDLQAASEQNRRLFMESIEALAAAVDARDPYTKGHSGRVSQYSVMLAKELGLPDEEVSKVRVSATLHDVGKIGIEDRVLKKPGVLSNDEFEVMKRHTLMGYEIARQVRELEEMLPGIRWHHEALNGKGYPDGIAGDKIPLLVRIIAVADTFDAITTDRPYQAGRDFPQALEILRKHSGTKYDPIVVDAMHACYEKGRLRKAEVRRTSQISVPQPTP